MSRKLIIDSSAQILIVALDDGERNELILSDNKKHNQVIFPIIEKLFDVFGIGVDDLDAIYCVVGPGSFTGVRLGVAIANALSQGKSIKLYAVSKLDVLAYEARDLDRIAAVDAKHDNYYYAAYSKGNVSPCAIGECDGRFIRHYNCIARIVDTSMVASEYARRLLEYVTEVGIEPVDVLSPMYLKLSQAERELNAKSAEYRIMPMALGHLDEVVKIEQDSFPDYLAMSEQAIKDEIHNELGEYYVIVKDDHVVGFGGFLTISDEAHIMDIAIEQEQRGNGYGKILLQYLIERARNLNLSAMTLEVNVHNVVAISLYEQCGFRQAGIRKKYYDATDDALLYWLRFGNNN